MKPLQNLLLWAFALNLFASPALFAEEMAEEKPAVTASGYVGAVSNYVWRGVPQNAGASSVQGELTFSFTAIEGLSLGIWVASIGGYDGTGTSTALPSNETDYFISYEFTAAKVDYSVGVTMYSYDFNAFNANAGIQQEIFFGAAYKDFSATFYMIPAENSTLGAGVNPAKGESLNWLELGYATKFAGFDTSLTYGTGSYNQQWVNAGNAVETTGILTLNLVKPLTETESLSFNGTYVVGQSSAGAELKNQFWMSYDVNY